MLRRSSVVVVLAVVLVFTAACTNKKVHNPLADVNSKQSDKVLFDRAMDAMKHNRFEVARITLQTMINTYPDSEYLARAKLAVADSWYAEGGSAALAQAEAEYHDFITFFPNMKEAAEAQLKIANIHYSQMEKPDRDFTHAVRAEEEFRQVMLQYPENKQMTEEARKKLLKVQEVIAEREFGVGRFYFLRESYPASIARLKSLTDKYPLYSKADEALYMLGQAYEGEIELVRARPSRQLNEAQKGAMIQEFMRNATEAYSKILTRYPLMDRADDAKLRLQAMHQPVPKPTKAAVAQNRAEEASRHEAGMLKTIMGNFQKHPDTSQAANVGQPTLNEPQMVTASDVVQQANRAARGTSSKEIGVVSLGSDAPPPSQEPPRSDAPAGGDNGAPPAAADPNELKPNVGPDQSATANDPSELKPNIAPGAVQPAPPQQVNEIQPGTQAADPAASPANQTDDQTADDSTTSSSKHKKKKGLKKIVPF
jgi:outer membrane protein assembly factor BamD